MSDADWVVLELTPKADGEDPDIIKASIRHRLRDAEVFIPASVVQRGQIREFQYLVDGYAFVRNTHPEGHYARLAETKYVQSPLYRSAGRRDRRLATITASEVERMRAQIAVKVNQGIEIGDTVLITSGPYKNIPARVCEEVPEHDSVVVHIQLRSTNRLVTLPRAFLHLEAKSNHVPFRDQIRRLGEWVDHMKTWLGWGEKLVKVKAAAKRLEALDGYVARLAALDLGAVENPNFASPAKALSTYAQWSLLNAYDSRLSAIRASLHALGQRKEGRLNVVIDGTNLLVRCLEATGLGKLKDKKGRATGPMMAFLRSLTAYRKRFPTADIYVCWDGSSRRRKEMFSGYKAGRAARTPADAFGLGGEWLRNVLRVLGVHQAHNPDEEADDVIASLVNGPLRESPNIIVTADRDLLQLVSDTAYQLCPRAGAAKEKLYDPAQVEAEYGVPPSLMVQLRALSGDASDHIPGAPGFGLKTAARAIKVYGSISTLYKSSLAGMTRNQSRSLRASESQVRLNVELMCLQQVPLTVIEGNADRPKAEAWLRSISMRPEPVLAAFTLR